MLEAAVSLDPYNLEFVQDKDKTYSLYKSALKPFSNSLKDFPQELITQELVKAAVKLDKKNLEYIPNHFLTDNIYELACLDNFDQATTTHSLEGHKTSLIGDDATHAEF